MNSFSQFLNDESGATAIEYGLLASLIALAIIVGATAVGTQINALFSRVASRLTSYAT